jgi:hypothetical protein
MSRCAQARSGEPASALWHCSFQGKSSVARGREATLRSRNLSTHFGQADSRDPWTHGRPFVVMGFTIVRGTIVEIDCPFDPERLARLDPAVLDGTS